jgi:hypothetical protein
MTRVLRRLHTDERGSVIFFVVAFLPVALAIGAFVIDAANLFEHKRHLQMQADAGALAGAQEFQHCFVDPDSANAAIEAAAMSYSGEDHNAQIGADDAQDRVEQRINAASWTEESFTDGEPCDTGYVDVKLTEKDSPAFFPFIGDNDVQAHARVQVFKIVKSNKLLPIAVPDPDPKVARAYFVDESKPANDLNYVLASVPLKRNGSSNGLAIWDNSGANPEGGAVPVDVPITADHVGVRIALGGNTSTTCGALLVDCYDMLSTHGLVHIQGWNNSGTGAPKTPITRSVTLTPGTCADAYYTDVTASCTVGVTAKVDFGASPTVLQATLTANVGGVNLAMAYNPATSTWTSTGTAAVAPQAGPRDVSFSWQIQKNANGTNCSPNNSCRGNLPVAQRAFTTLPDRAGPISLAQVSLVGSTDPPNSVERCSAVHTSCTRSYVVKIGIKGGIALNDLDDPPVRLRVIGGSQNQSLDCDPALSNLKDELALGCSKSYTPYTGAAPCPSSASELWAIQNPPNAWECVAVQTGNASNQIAAGLNTRILGTDKPSSCPPARQNHWPDYQAGDPRIVFVLVTPFGAFSGSGSTTVPVMRFAAFYITGWTGQGGGFDNPCLTQGDEMPTNPAEIVGRFIKYVDVPNEGGTGDEECDFSAIEPCAAVLVE